MALGTEMNHETPSPGFFRGPRPDGKVCVMHGASFCMGNTLPHTHPGMADFPYLLNALFLASLNPSLLLPHLHFPFFTHKENITEYKGEGCRRESPYNLYHLYKLWCHLLYYPLTHQYRPRHL